LRLRPPEKHEFELIRYGKGQMFGELQHAMKNAIEQDRDLENIVI